MPDATVFIVDDDPSVRDSLGLLLGLRGYRTAIFADAESFLHAYRPDWRGCVLLDIRMPGMDGLELQKRLNVLGCLLPVVVMRQRRCGRRHGWRSLPNWQRPSAALPADSAR